MPSESDLVREFEESENNESSGAGGTEDSQNPGSTQTVDEVDEETLGAIETIDVALQTADDSSYVLDNETKFITTVIFNKDNN